MAFNALRLCSRVFVICAGLDCGIVAVVTAWDAVVWGWDLAVVRVVLGIGGFAESLLVFCLLWCDA